MDLNTWPAIGFENMPWQPDETGFPVSRRARMAARGDYQASIPLKIANLSVALESELVAEIEDATTALVKFDYENGAYAAPFSQILLRSESAASSEVENLTVNVKNLFLAELGFSATKNAEIVVDNVSAMRAALALSENLTSDAILKMHQTLLERSRPDIAGIWRDKPVWIGGNSPHAASFVGPNHTRINELIDDLLVFINRTDLPILAQIAIAHAQFETIHPFEDGNGRTGRAIIQAMLKHLEITNHTVAPVSAGLLSNTENYFKALAAYRAGQLKPIIQTFTNASFKAINSGKHLMNDLRSIKEQWQKTLVVRSDSAARKLLELLPQQPIVSVDLVQKNLKISAPAATAAIAQLEKQNILTPINSNRRNRIWEAPEIIRALDNFAERSRRQ
ncbi:MAG: hypothetical protein RL174_314 [Actinomycetota bacterium]